MACWNEGGQTWVNISTDDGTGNIDTKELVHTYRLGDIEALYPKDWP